MDDRMKQGLVVKFKWVRGGAVVAPQHPTVPAGPSADGRVITYDVINVPLNVDMARVQCLMNGTAITGPRYTIDYHELGIGAIIKATAAHVHQGDQEYAT